MRKGRKLEINLGASGSSTATRHSVRKNVFGFWPARTFIINQKANPEDFRTQDSRILGFRFRDKVSGVFDEFFFSVWYALAACIFVQAL